MATLPKSIIDEPQVHDAKEYGRRVHRLAAAYVGVFVLSLTGIGLIIWKAQLFVNLSQRSNVETLTLAFFVLFFAYLALLSVTGVRGALYIGYFWLRLRLGHDPLEVERAKLRVRARRQKPPPVVALNVVLARAEDPHTGFSLPIEDAAGSMGTIVVNGASVKHVPASRDGSNALLSYVVVQINDVLERREEQAEVDIVEWQKIDDEAAEKYLGIVAFACNLERQLNVGPLWPARLLTAEDREQLTRQLSTVCSALRDEALLPDWEYAGEHRIPLIPEPLGLIALSRTEKRVDPLASMGCAVAIVLAVVVVLVLVILFPPWVPGV